jgi:hypothetical protein
MNKNMLVIAMILMVGAMLVTPVMAKGPLKAIDKNPNAEILQSGTFPLASLELTPPSEITNRWFGPEGVRVIVKPADKFYNPTDIVLDEADVMLWFSDYRATWVKMTKSAYELLFTMFDLPPPTDVPDEGVYIWGAKTS